MIRRRAGSESKSRQLPGRKRDLRGRPWRCRDRPGEHPAQVHQRRFRPLKARVHPRQPHRDRRMAGIAAVRRRTAYPGLAAQQAPWFVRQRAPAGTRKWPCFARRGGPPRPAAIATPRRIRMWRGPGPRRLVGETCSWLNPIPGCPLPAAVSVWGPRRGNDDRAALEGHPLSRQRKLRECAPVLGCCPHEVPLPGSHCGVGNGRTIAWTAHDDEFSSRDRSLAVAEQPAEGRRARCQAQW